MGKRAIVLLAGFLLAGFCSCGGPTREEDGTIGISGTIRVAATGAPVFQVSLTLFGSGSGNVYTDLNGYYRFSNLQDGTYTVVPEKIGFTFLPPTLTVTVSGASVSDQDFLAFGVPAAAGDAGGPPRRGEEEQDEAIGSGIPCGVRAGSE